MPSTGSQHHKHTPLHKYTTSYYNKLRAHACMYYSLGHQNQ